MIFSAFRKGDKIITVKIIINRGNWNHFKVLQNILEQRTRKARTTKHSYTGHSTHTAGSANVEVQRSLILKTALYAP
jgi:hypothetical protein